MKFCCYGVVKFLEHGMRVVESDILTVGVMKFVFNTEI